MKNLILLLLVVQATVSLNAQSFETFANYVNSLSDPLDKQDAVDSFMTAASAFPYISGDTATFIHQGSASSAAVAGDFNGWDFSVGEMTSITSTDLRYRSMTFEMDARLDYKIVLDGGTWIVDPLNPNTVLGGFGPNSELAMPDYVQPWEIDIIPGVDQGSIESFSLSSTHTGSTFQIRVYLPPSYSPATGTQYPAAYFQDGFEYVDLAGTDNVIDNLIDEGSISEMLGVFVKPNNRNEEYAFSDRVKYRLFFINELVPYIDANYKTIKAASARAVIGASFGGNISTLIAGNHPDIFGNCGIHSGAYWPNSNEAYDLIIDGAKKDIRFASIWGSYEGSLSSNMHNFKNDLLTDGYDLLWDELPEGHSWGLWRATTDEFLKFFFPPGLTSVNTLDISALKVYPVPTDQHLNFDLAENSQLAGIVRLTDLSGKSMLEKSFAQGENLVLDVSELPAGNYVATINFDKGTAYSRLISIR